MCIIIFFRNVVTNINPCVTDKIGLVSASPEKTVKATIKAMNNGAPWLTLSPFSGLQFFFW